MKQRIFLLTAIMTLWLIPELKAQPNDREEKVEAIKVGYLTNHMNLTPTEAQVFWPVYNAFQAELKAVREARREYNFGKWRKLDTMSDSEIKELLDKQFEFEQQELDVKKKYYYEFLKVLTPLKVAQYFKAEEEFKLWLLKKAREQKQNKRGRGPGRR